MGQVEDDGMSRARIEAARTGLRLIARLSTEDNVRAIAEGLLEQLADDQGDEARRVRDRDRKRRERGGSDPPRPSGHDGHDGHARTVVDMTDRGRTGKGEGVSVDLETEIEIENTNPPEPHVPSVSARTESVGISEVARRDLRCIAKSLRGQHGNAASLKDRYEEALRDLGWLVEREVAVSDAFEDGRNGRVDLVARKDGETLVIELDNLTPRGRSVLKMARFRGCVRVSILRCAQWGWREGTEWADVVIGMEWQGGQVVPMRSYPRSAVEDGCMGYTVGVWRDAVCVVTAGTLSPMAPGEQRKLTGAIVAHGPKKDPRALLEWTKQKATAYASSCMSVGAEISVWGFARWCDNGFQHTKGLQRGGPGKIKQGGEGMDPAEGT
jgi:hypothetical protein